MLDLQTRLSSLKRPQLLARAARSGVDDYRRSTHLRRLLHCEALPQSGAAIMQLLDKESEINEMRLAKSGNYRPSQHVEVLIAIAGEAKLMQATKLHSV